MAVKARLQVAMLPGGRLHLQDGPIDLVIKADGCPAAVGRAYRAATDRAATILDELCGELALLRVPAARDAEGAVARRMQRAVRPYETACFITPMAAVAGAVADAVLDAVGPWDLRRVTVNNGGDIAVYLAAGQHLVAGMVARAEAGRLFGRLRLDSAHGARGIATSGFGGRSDTFGIADAVTVLAASAAAADAAATMVANAVDLPGHPAIRRGPSRRAQSDLGDRAVTQAVGALDAAEIGEALERGAAMARRLMERGLLAAAALHLRGVTVLVQDFAAAGLVMAAGPAAVGLDGAEPRGEAGLASAPCPAMA